MKLLKKFALLSWILFLTIDSFAQDTADLNQKNFMTGDGKIFVVMAVVTVIVLGLFIYLINLDRKINKLEKNLRK